MYNMVVNQLVDDGHVGAASAVAASTLAQMPTKAQNNHALARRLQGRAPDTAAGGGLDLDAGGGGGPPAAAYRTCWVAPGAGGAAAFGADGTHAAVGAADGSVRLLDAALLAQGGAQDPVLRVYNEHRQAVTDLDFHPGANANLLVSASQDATLRFYNFPGAPRASRQCTDTHAIHAVRFHPAGGHLLVGTAHHSLHLYDVATFRCFTSTQPMEEHSAPIAAVAWAADGKSYASVAGPALKLWDGRTCRCSHTVPMAHRGEAVTSVAFSHSGRYVLTAGADGMARLWDVAAAKSLLTYEGGGGGGEGGGGGGGGGGERAAAYFCAGEALVGGAVGGGSEVLLWDAKSGALAQRLAGHAAPLRALACSAAAPVLLSCSADGQVRGWVE